MGGDRKGLSKRYIAQALEDSLTRLQTDYIDLYQAHQDDPNTLCFSLPSVTCQSFNRRRHCPHRSLAPLRHLDFERAPERPQRCFRLIQPRSMIKIEQPIDLRHVPTQAPCQFAFLHTLVAHGLVDRQLDAG
jgi:Aldo/keto reductase family